MGLEVSGHASDGVCLAENTGDSLPRGEDSDGRLGRGGLFGQTASVRRGFQASVDVRRACRDGRQRTAAMVVIGGVVFVVILLLRERLLQVLLAQVVHFVLSWVVDWIFWVFI